MFFHGILEVLQRYSIGFQWYSRGFQEANWAFHGVSGMFQAVPADSTRFQEHARDFQVVSGGSRGVSR